MEFYWENIYNFAKILNINMKYKQSNQRGGNHSQNVQQVIKRQRDNNVTDLNQIAKERLAAVSTDTPLKPYTGTKPQ
jgi:dynactin complex subunit